MEQVLQEKSQETNKLANRYDKDKPRLDLVPSKPMLEVANAFTFGAEKYDPHNWRKGLSWTKTIGSAERHINALKDGEDLDKESGCYHAALAICNLLFILEFYKTHPELDDRYHEPS